MQPSAKPFRLAAVLLLALLCGFPRGSAAQDNVTVPKSRLEELERKEKELERLKGAKPAIQEDKVQTQPKPEPGNSTPPPVLAPAPEPVVRYTSPALESLPALRPNDPVESMDLANYYYADSASADRRFLKQKLAVRGEIVGFEKPLWKSSYRILLKTPIRGVRVICDLPPPTKSNAVFTTNHGDDLVAMFGEKRVTFAKVGQTVIVLGECKGYSDSAVKIYAWDVKPSH
jgi:hypothetical protein